MISLDYSNPTPWDSPRECSEEELWKKLETIASLLITHSKPPESATIVVAEICPSRDIASDEIMRGTGIYHYKPLDWRLFIGVWAQWCAPAAARTELATLAYLS